MRRGTARGMLIAGCAIVHYLVLVMVVLLGFSRSMDRWDTIETGAAVGATWVDTLLDVAVNVLGFPVFPLLDSLPSTLRQVITYGPMETLLTIANSLLWGIAIVMLVRWLQQRRIRAHSPFA